MGSSDGKADGLVLGRREGITVGGVLVSVVGPDDGCTEGGKDNFLLV